MRGRAAKHLNRRRPIRLAEHASANNRRCDRGSLSPHHSGAVGALPPLIYGMRFSLIGGLTKRGVPQSGRRPSEDCVTTSLSHLRCLLSYPFYPRLAPWAAFLRRFAARILTLGLLFVQSGGCDTVS